MYSLLKLPTHKFLSNVEKRVWINDLVLDITFEGDRRVSETAREDQVEVLCVSGAVTQPLLEHIGETEDIIVTVDDVHHTHPYS